MHFKVDNWMPNLKWTGMYFYWAKIKKNKKKEPKAVKHVFDTE